MEPKGGPGSRALRVLLSEKRGRRQERMWPPGSVSFSLFFKEGCVTVVHLYAARTPFSEERLVTQERKGVRAGAEFANGKENVIRHRQRDGCQQGGPDGGFGGRERGFNREAFREVEGLVGGG